MCPQGHPHQLGPILQLHFQKYLNKLLMCPQGHPHHMGPILSWHFPKVLNAKAKNEFNLDLFMRLGKILLGIEQNWLWGFIVRI